jgi:hypothetical protein
MKHRPAFSYFSKSWKNNYNSMFVWMWYTVITVFSGHRKCIFERLPRVQKILTRYNSAILIIVISHCSFVAL